MRGGGSAPTDLRTFARNRTLPQEATDVSIYDKGPGLLHVSGPVAPRLFKILHPNFYEKALFVKPTWRLVSVAECNGFCPSRYASIRTSEEPHASVALCI